MATAISLEDRVAELEREVAILRNQVAKKSETKDWISQISGKFKDDPEFDEILRLGREYRAAQRDESP